MTAVLGPCPCQGCGALVWWDGWRWTDHRGRKHGHRPSSVRRYIRVGNGIAVERIARCVDCGADLVALNRMGPVPRRCGSCRVIHDRKYQRDYHRSRRTSVRNHLTSKAAMRYDQRAGSSSKSARIAPGARLSATTREAGVVASIEVVAR